MSPTSSLRDSTVPQPSTASDATIAKSAGAGVANAEIFHHKGWRASLSALLRAPRSRLRKDSTMGRNTLLVRIISVTPRQAVMPSSRTICMSIIMMTMKPSALVNNATAPGMNSLRKAAMAASREVRPASTSCFHALVI